jgi:hypothetical protein
MKCFWKNYRLNKFFEQKEVKRVGQVREDITLFIKTQTYKKKESLRKVQPSNFFTLHPNVKAEMIFEKRNSKKSVGPVINFCAKISVRAYGLF